MASAPGPASFSKAPAMRRGSARKRWRRRPPGSPCCSLASRSPGLGANCCDGTRKPPTPIASLTPDARPPRAAPHRKDRPMTATPDNDDTAPTAAHHAIRDGIDNARSQVNEATHKAIARTKDGLDQARGAVADAYASGRDRAADAYATAREKARTAGRSAADSLDSNPMAALLGGLAIGAI